MSIHPRSQPLHRESGAVVPPPRVSGRGPDEPVGQPPPTTSSEGFPTTADGAAAQRPVSGPPTGRRADRHADRRSHRRRRWWLTALIAAVLLIVPGVSFARAMTYPGQAPLSVRAVEWVRDNGGGGLVNTVETWWYTRHPPPRSGKPVDVLTQPGAAPTRAADQVLPRVRLLGMPVLAGEGAWRIPARTPTGKPALYTTWFRPDAGHTSVAIGVALIPQQADRLHLVGGTREPAPGLSWPQGFKVPTADRPQLVAAFNAGFKMKDANGGWYGEGKTAAPLVNGAASLVIARDGRATVGAWGGDLRLTPDVVAVRQNLALVIENGRPVPGLNGNAHGRWGSSRNQLQYTWRSGLGTDTHGDLIYVAGRGLTLTTLADGMSKAGIQTGMELDIHTTMVTFNLFNPQNRAADQTGTKLLASMSQPSHRYLGPDQRDFFYVTVR